MGDQRVEGFMERQTQGMTPEQSPGRASHTRRALPNTLGLRRPRTTAPGVDEIRSGAGQRLTHGTAERWGGSASAPSRHGWA